tara:strand:- start:405 stop:1112 length:708 start_codon:yes stop_codon:yes gene_type:complete
MSKDPAFLFYSSDFLTGVSDLTMEERGQFITLLCLQHQKGALSEKLMRLQCGGIPNADVLAKFRIDKNGFYYNERIEHEKDRRAKHSAKQRDNAYKRWNKDNNTSKQTLSNGNAMAMPLETETETETVNEIEVDIYPSFDDFWNLYDKKRGRRKQIKSKWSRLNQNTKEMIMMHLPKYIESTPDKSFRKDPQTYLNQEAWLDEIIIKNNNNGTTKKNASGVSRDFAERIVRDLQS